MTGILTAHYASLALTYYWCVTYTQINRFFHYITVLCITLILNGVKLRKSILILQRRI